MKYCENCGRPVDQSAVYCPHCGRSLPRQDTCCRPGEQPYYPVPRQKDTGSIGWGILGFLLPVIGLILYLVWKDEQPRNARRAGTGALISVIVSMILGVIYFLLILTTFDFVQSSIGYGTGLIF